MDPEAQLEIQIEQVRNSMYLAYKSNATYDEILKISQKLDQLLNDLESLKKQAQLMTKTTVRSS